MWESPKNRGPLFWGPYNKDPTISGTIFGSPVLGNSHVVSCTPRYMNAGGRRRPRYHRRRSSSSSRSGSSSSSTSSSSKFISPKTLQLTDPLFSVKPLENPYQPTNLMTPS